MSRNPNPKIVAVLSEMARGHSASLRSCVVREVLSPCGHRLPGVEAPFLLSVILGEISLSEHQLCGVKNALCIVVIRIK